MEDSKPKKIHSRSEAKLKAASFCAYQERSQKEVRSKLYDLGLYRDDVEEVLSELITENFINEERFAKAYVGGKFRIKKWGRRKIAQGLYPHQLSAYCIQKGMEELDPDDYYATLESLIVKKSQQLKANNLFAKRSKIANHAISRGFESDLIWEILKERVLE